MIERDRGQRVLRMVEGQLRRADERFQGLVAELDVRKPKAVSLRFLAVCTLEVTP